MVWALLVLLAGPALASDDDATPPYGDITIHCDAQPGERFAPSNPVMSCFWNMAHDDESAVSYYVRLDTQADSLPDANDTKVSSIQRQSPLPGEGSFWFHVRAASDGGLALEVAHYGPILVGYPKIPAEDLQAVDKEASGTLVAEAAKEGVALSWRQPTAAVAILRTHASGSSADGIKVWRAESNGTWSLVSKIGPQETGFIDPAGHYATRYTLTFTWREGQGVGPATGTFGSSAYAALRARIVDGVKVVEDGKGARVTWGLGGAPLPDQYIVWHRDGSTWTKAGSVDGMTDREFSFKDREQSKHGYLVTRDDDNRLRIVGSDLADLEGVMPSASDKGAPAASILGIIVLVGVAAFVRRR